MDKRRWIYLIALIGMLAITKYFKGIGRPSNETASSIEALQGKDLIYTKHANCRMDCRTISPEEVEEVLATGRHNIKKSDPYDKPCPTYALEDYTDDGQLVRIVFAACDDIVKVVTAIDLNKEYRCHCD